MSTPTQLRIPNYGEVKAQIGIAQTAIGLAIGARSIGSHRPDHDRRAAAALRAAADELDPAAEAPTP